MTLAPHFSSQVLNVSFAFELMQDGGLEKPKPRPEGTWLFPGSVTGLRDPVPAHGCSGHRASLMFDIRARVSSLKSSLRQGRWDRAKLLGPRDPL